MSIQLWDMHIHLDFMRNAPEVVREVEALGLGMFAVTVTPSGFLRFRKDLENAENVRLGVGLHPWWIADGRCGFDDALRTAELAAESRFVGEIGLDASPKHVPEGSLPAQVKAFEAICTACAAASDPAAPKILSIHSVKAAGLTLDILEQSGCLKKCRCIFHWFTGSNEELTRAVRSGCMFSVNEMMLRTRRGREYARQIPSNRLLLETDLPPGENIIFHASDIDASLNRTLEALQEIRGKDMRDTIAGNVDKLVRSS